MYKKLSMATAISLCLLTGQFAQADARTQAKQIFDRLAGSTPSEGVLDAMELRISDSNDANYDPEGKTAADLAMEDPAFYNVTLKNFAAPWTNEEQTVFAPLNDYTATVIGLIRDDDDFRKVLYDNVVYTGSDISDYSNSNNNHYEALESENLMTELTRRTQTELPGGIPDQATAGVMTTRAAAKSFFYLGTNRAMFRFTLMNHLCTDLEPIKDNTRPANRVRQDVSRSPGGDSRIFLNSCLGCHAGMDGLAGAYAFYDLDFNGDKDEEVAAFESSANMTFSDGVVTDKHLINENNFKPGYITTDNSWINYWRNGQNSLMGWNDYPGVQKDDKGNAIGTGAKSMGMELAHSEAFAQCQVKKAFQTVCLRNPNDYLDDRNKVDEILSNFGGGAINIKTVFREVAAHCKGS